MKLTEHTITIQRDLTQVIHAKKWDHEMPILKILHGTDNVKILSSEEIDFPGFNVSDEYHRLKAKYNRKDDGNMALVQREYGNDAQRLAERLGVTHTPGIVKQKKSVQIDNRASKVRGSLPPPGMAKLERRPSVA